MSVTTDASTAASSSANELSQQSAFFGFLALYLSVLSQNAGALPPLPSAHRLPLRSSPLVCAADTILLLAHPLLLAVLCGCAPRTAMRLAW
jgi:hypothetical protein